ncbi:hypothetical protein M0R04_16010 [Candidatus Dojkabacteria bacterium]|jgi:hypothetical protein|nr:hypothetical protein [Candidatus Dojkabacteria bacterium]
MVRFRTDVNVAGDFSHGKWDIPASGEYNALASIKLTAGAGGVSKYDLLYITSAGTVLKAMGDVSTTMRCFGMATADITAASSDIVMIEGLITNSGWAWTPGVDLFVSDTTAGAISSSVPSSGHLQQRVGLAITATTIYFYGNGIYFEVE